jgi:hypothetical protein
MAVLASSLFLLPDYSSSSVPINRITARPTTCAGIFKQSIGARNRVGIGLSYRSARLHSLAESIPRNKFLVFVNVYKCGLRVLFTHFLDYQYPKCSRATVLSVQLHA